MSHRWSVVLAVAVFAGACSGGAEAPPPAAQPPATAAAPATVAPAPPAAAAGEIGVPECDRYLKNYQACLETKVPAANRSMLQGPFDQIREGWKKAAATPEGKAGLAMACTQAETASKAAVAAYGCTW